MKLSKIRDQLLEVKGRASVTLYVTDKAVAKFRINTRTVTRYYKKLEIDIPVKDTSQSDYKSLILKKVGDGPFDITHYINIYFRSE